MRHKLFLLAVLALSLVAQATDYGLLSVKADRFFDQKEWASASAMYELMLDDRPGTPQVYGRAIVAAAMAGDTVAEVGLMNRSIVGYVPFDSTFAAVRAASFEIGRTNLYEDFLLRVRQSEPWLSRTVDAYLMRYYTFRRNPPMMERYSEEMLRGMPDDVAFLSTLAQGQLLSGDSSGAMDTYRRILAIDADCYDALLYIGNYNYMLWSRDRSSAPARQAARSALRRAQSLHPTPFMAALLAELDKN